MYTIPKELIKVWDTTKTKLIPSIDTVSDTISPPAEKRQLKTQLTGLFDQFDKGLKAKMKVAASAKTDADARKAAKDVFDIAGEYGGKVHATAEGCPATLKPSLTPHLNKIEKVLQQIRQHALASAKSRPPITFNKELDEIAATFDKGQAQVKSVGKTKYKLNTAQQASLEKYFSTLNLLLKPHVLSAKHARSEIDLYAQLGELRNSIEAYRTKDLPAWWQKQTTMPKSAAELPKRLDMLFMTMRTNTEVLMKQLKSALA